MSSSSRRTARPVCHRLVLAFPLLCSSLGLTAALLPLSASAQVAAATYTFDIPAGPMATALNQAGETAGVALGFSPTLVAGMDSPGLRGTYPMAEALQRLLAGSGLAAVARADGGYVLHRLPEASAASGPVETLATVRVTGRTEGSGSYTTELSDTATKLDLSLRETPQSVTVMTHKRMEDQGLSEITQVLDEAPGLYFNHTSVVGGDGNPVYARGFEMQNYQVDGMARSHRYGFKQDVADTAVYDRVEIVRGASGLLNGVGEPAGAVNLVRKLPTREFQASVAAKVGSWRFYRTEADLSGAITEDGRVRGRVVAAYQDNDTFVDRVNATKEVFYGIVEADLTPYTLLTAGIEHQRHKTHGAGSMHSAAALFYPDGRRTDFDPSTNMAADWSATRRDNLTLFAGLEHTFDNDWRVRLDADYSRRKYDFTVADASLRNASAPDAGVFRGYRNAGQPQQQSVAVHASGPFELFGREHELVVGGSYSRFKDDTQGYREISVPIVSEDALYRLISTGYFPQADMGPTGASSTLHDTQSGLYATTRLRPMDRVSIILGSRLSYWKTRTDRTSAAGVLTRGVTNRASAVLTPYAGVVLDVTEQLSVYASYTDIFQPASLYDANGDLLDPAEGKNLEAGLKWSLLDDSLNLSAAVYETRKDNVPQYVTSSGGSLGPTGHYIYEGLDGTKTTGIELELVGHVTPDWQIAASYSDSKPVAADGKPRLTYIPRRMVKLFTSYQPRQLLPGLTLGANLRWQGEISSTDPYPYTQGGVTTLDLMAHYEFNRHWSATLNLNNVFDKRYYTNINVGGWSGEPRSAFVNLRYRF